MEGKFILSKLVKYTSAVILSLSLLIPKPVDAEVRNFNMSYIYFSGPQLYEKYVDRTNKSLHVISPNYFNIDEDGNLEITKSLDKSFIQKMHSEGIDVIPFLSNHWDRQKGRKALENKENLAEQIADAVSKYNLDGVNVDIENVTETDKDDFTDFVKILRQELSKDKIVSVAVAGNPNNIKTGWHGSYDYEKLGKYSDYLVLMTYDESYAGGLEGPVASLSFVEKSIAHAIKRIPKEKIVIGIPFYGRYWQTDSEYGGYGISLTTVNSLIEDYDGKVIYDKEKESPMATITIRQDGKKPKIFGKELSPGKYNIWFENEESIKKKLSLVNKYDIMGTASWSLGQELPETWEYYDLALNGTVFTDISNHWARQSILDVNSKGWMKGTNETIFAPEKPLTRAQGAAVLVRALNLEKKNDSKEFNDVSNHHWAKDEIEIASSNGIIMGRGDGKFDPEKPITREEMAAMLDRTLENLSNDYSNYLIYNDVDFARWSYNSIIKLSSNGIFTGYEDGYFRPNEKITRAQMAVLMDRINNYIE